VTRALSELSERYRQFHEDREKHADFVYVPERVPYFVAAVGGPGKRVLDIGCRAGALSQYFLDGNEVTGIDVDEEALSHAAARGLHTIWGDVEEPLPFDDASFDVVVVGEILEHVRFPDEVVAEIGRVLAPDGVVVGSVPNVYRLKNRLKFLLGRPPENNPMHLRMYSPTLIRAELAPIGPVKLAFVGGRLVRMHGSLFANVLVFSAQRGKPS
jgi:methionine biosynthesis protein MetW